jgi:Protein of unknown function (DUF4238)
MAKDHYVPRHYLRQFSVSDSREHVTAAEVCPYKFLGRKGLGSECQKKDFEEGDEKLGKLLGVSERDLAPVLVSVALKQSFTGPELSALKLFAATQNARTRKATEAYKVFPKRIFYEIAKSGIESGRLPPPPGGELTEEMVDFKGVLGLLVQNAFVCWLEMNTLECKLLQAPEGTYFITSDHPTAVLNQFCVGAHRYRHFAGFNKSGFQLFLPLSPELCLLFYDAKIYKVGSPRHVLIPISATDVELVNSLQIQTAEEKVYFHDPRFEPQVRKLIRLYAQFRVSVQKGLVTLPGPNENDELLLFRQLGVKIPKPWQFCKVRRHVKFNPGDLRNPEWSALVDELMVNLEKHPNGGNLSGWPKLMSHFVKPKIWRKHSCFSQ